MRLLLLSLIIFKQHINVVVLIYGLIGHGYHWVHLTEEVRISIMYIIYLNYPLFFLNTGRRRRHSSPSAISPLTRAFRRKRQVTTSGTSVYNLPSSYSIDLPSSCCKSGATTFANSLSGCEYLSSDRSFVNIHYLTF